MKLIGSITEDEHRKQLNSSRQAIFYEPGYGRLLDEIRARFPGMRTAYVLEWTPEQGEDIYSVLVDCHNVIVVELERNSSGGLPSVDVCTVDDYRRGLSQADRIKLAVALDLAQKDLGRK